MWQELAANKINYGIKISKSKFGAALAAHSQMQQNSGGSSPDSIRHMQGRPGGCNGLHSTTATNRLVHLCVKVCVSVFGVAQVVCFGVKKP